MTKYTIDPSLQGTNRLKRPRETEEVLIGSRAQPETQLALPRFPNRFGYIKQRDNVIHSGTVPCAKYNEGKLFLMNFDLLHV